METPTMLLTSKHELRWAHEKPQTNANNAYVCATRFYHADGLGSITSLTDTTGSVAASYVYDSFGNLTASTGTVTNPFQYTGREFDSETGLYYYRARYYDPVGGRFLSEDPIQFVGGVDFYHYALNNPGRLVDPFGYVEMSFDTSYRQLHGFWQWYWYAGLDIWGKPALSATCDCVGSGKYKLNIKIRFPIHITYMGPRTKAHEEKHNDIEEEFFRRQGAKYHAFEQTYPSLVECEYYRQRSVTGFPDNGRTPDLMNEILEDAKSQELVSAEEEVDNWFDRLVFH
jgi:RHS repeat-associated protein